MEYMDLLHNRLLRNHLVDMHSVFHQIHKHPRYNDPANIQQKLHSKLQLYNIANDPYKRFPLNFYISLLL